MEKSPRTPWRRPPLERRPLTGPESFLLGHPATQQIPLSPLETKWQAMMAECCSQDSAYSGRAICWEAICVKATAPHDWGPRSPSTLLGASWDQPGALRR